MPESVALDKTAIFEDRKAAIYSLTWKTPPCAKVRYRALLRIACDETDTTEIRHEALNGLSMFFPRRPTYALLPILQDANASSTLREEVAHVLGMTDERRPLVIRALMDVWKTAPPTVRVYIAYCFACIGHPRFIPLLRESQNDFTPASDLRWTLAQECRWAITCCRKVRLIGEDGLAAEPNDPAFLSPTWERETQYLRAKGRSVRPR